jgi:hypothetical protein
MDVEKDIFQRIYLELFLPDIDVCISSESSITSSLNLKHIKLMHSRFLGHLITHICFHLFHELERLLAK